MKILFLIFSFSLVACSHSPVKNTSASENESKQCINEHYQVVRCEKIKYFTTKDKNGKEQKLKISF